MDFSSIVSAVSGAVSGLGSELGAIASFGSEIVGKIKPITDVFNSVKGIASNVVSSVKGTVSKVTSNIKSIFGGSSAKATTLPKISSSTSSNATVKQIVNTVKTNSNTVKSVPTIQNKAVKSVKSDWRPIYNGYTNELKGE